MVTVRRTVASFCKTKIEVSVRSEFCRYHGLWLQVACELLTGLSTQPRSLHCLGSAVRGGFLWKVFALLSSSTACS